MQDPALLARSLNRLGNWYANVERPRDARQYHQEALFIFEGLNDRRGMAETLDLLGSACYMSDDLCVGTTYTRRAVKLFQELGNRQGLASALAMLALDGLSGEAEMALRIAHEIGWRSGEAFALIRLGFCLGEQGEYARAFELLQAGLELAQAIEHQQGVTAAHFYLGELYRDLLWFSAAEQHLRQAVTLAQATGTSLWIHIVSARLAALHLLQNQAARAEAVLSATFGDSYAGHEGGTPGQSTGQRQAWCVRAELALATGRPELALRRTGELLASEVSRANPGERSTLHAMLVRSEALAALKRPAEAEAALQAVVEAAREKKAQPLRWRVALALGKLYHAQGRHAEAEEAFASARATVERLAAGVADPAIREHFLLRTADMFPAARQIAPRRAGKREWSGLTEREREVALLIAQGKSNREVAAALVVSERTVTTHVANILAKLGFSSRTQVASWVVEKQLRTTPPPQ